MIFSQKRNKVRFSRETLAVVDDYFEKCNITASERNIKRINSLRKIAK